MSCCIVDGGGGGAGFEGDLDWRGWRLMCIVGVGGEYVWASRVERHTLQHDESGSCQDAVVLLYRQWNKHQFDFHGEYNSLRLIPQFQ